MSYEHTETVPPFQNKAQYTNDLDMKTAMALDGKTLYGDDFSQDQIDEWFRTEQEGYFNLYYAPGGVRGPDGEQVRVGEYWFSQLVEWNLFKWLSGKSFESLLGVGCADGMELKPLLKRVSNVTILEPSDGFAATEIEGVPVSYVKPHASGVMPFPDNSFDVVVCIQALHHIPNVSTIVNEMYRVLKPGGQALLLEPSQSMGDWRLPHFGLTKNERGIPPDMFRNIANQAGFTITHQTPCMFSLTSRLVHIGIAPWRSPSVVRLDKMLCRLSIWPHRYHATRWWHKLRLTATALVLLKNG
jgi:SAM-dependent methyltransferase